jgi:hypothetical protein
MTRTNAQSIGIYDTCLRSCIHTFTPFPSMSKWQAGRTMPPFAANVFDPSIRARPLRSCVTPLLMIAEPPSSPLLWAAA